MKTVPAKNKKPAPKKATKVQSKAKTDRDALKERQRTAQKKAKEGKKKKDPDDPRLKRKRVGSRVVDRGLADDVLSKGGRPPELTELLAAKICDYVEAGHFVSAAVQGCGISRSAYYLWLERGEGDRRRGETTIYSQFMDKIKEAEFLAESRNLSAVQAGELGWQANAWLLERRFAARWGTKMRLSIEDARDFMRKFLTVAAQHIPDRDVLRKIVEDARRIEVETHALPA